MKNKLFNTGLDFNEFFGSPPFNELKSKPDAK